MSVDIRLKHSSQAGKVPDAGSLKSGEVAINTADVKAYIKNADGQVVQIAGADNPSNDGRYLRIDSGAGAQTVESTETTTFSGSAEFAGDVVALNPAENLPDATLLANGLVYGTRMEARNQTGQPTFVGSLVDTNDGSFENTARIEADGSAEFAGDVTTKLSSSGWWGDGGVIQGAGGYLYIAQNTNTASNQLFKLKNDNLGGDVVIFEANGTAQFKGDVAIGDSSAFFGTIGDAVALLPNSIVDQFKTVIDGLPKTQPYDATTLPADLPTPLKDALVRVTTAGKINLNSNGSADFAGDVTSTLNSWDTTNPASLGVNIAPGGLVQVKRSSASSTAKLLQGFGGTAETTTIYSDGSATFGVFTDSADLSASQGTGKTDIYNAGSSAEVRISKNAANTALGTYVRTNIFDATGKAQALVIGNENNINLATGAVNADGAHTVEINADGSASFAKYVDSGHTTGEGLMRIRQDSDTSAFAIYKTDSYDYKVRILGDGSAEFAGDVNVGFNLSNSSSAKAEISKIGTFTSYKGGASTDTAFAAYSYGKSARTIELIADGSATFDGIVQAGSTTGGNYGILAYSNAPGGSTFASVKARNYGTGRVWAGCNASDAVTSSIDASGAASFTTVNGASVILKLEPDNDDNYTVTTEEYEEQEEVTPYVPAVPATYDEEGNELTAEVPAVEATYQTVTKTREIRTYTGPTLDVKEELQFLRARATQQDEIIATLTEAVEALKAAPASDFESRIAALEVDMARFKAI